MKRHSPACDRNRDPILAQIRRWLEPGQQVLEIASGTGQHAVWFARHLPDIAWQPTDADPQALASVSAWRDEADLPNLDAPLALDVMVKPWPAGPADAVYCANMVHISPWGCTQALVAGAAGTINVGGVLMLYGPFRVGGRHTAPSNADFDRDLRSRNSDWGIRDLEEVGRLAQLAGLDHVETTPMPANNLFVVWRKRA